MKHCNSAVLAVWALALVCLFTSCRKEPLDIQSPNTRRCSSYLEQFEAVWEGVDHTYVLWARDTVDWDARYEKFRPVFEAFDARDNVTPEEYQAAWDAFMGGLLDHHMAVILYNPRNGGYRIAVRPASNSYTHITDRAAQVAALKSQPGVTDFVECSERNPYMNSVFCLLPGSEQGKKIAYLRFSEFAFSELFEDDTLPNKDVIEAPIRAFYGDDYTHGITNGAAARSDVESIIIDLRGNPGGNTADLSPIIGSLMQEHFHFGYSRYKEGLGRLDYSGWMRFDIPRPDHYLPEAKKVVVLSDINSVSCAELSTNLIKSLPKGTFIGERTYGGTCALSPNTDVTFDIYYTGCFGDKNLFPVAGIGTGKPTHPEDFAYYVYSGTFDVVTKEYKSLEGVGEQPDIEVRYDAAALQAGRDTQLEAALKYLREGK